MAAAQTGAERLRLEKERILAQWEARVRESIAPARAQERLALRNSLPEVIDGMILTLASEEPGHALSTEEQRLAVGHGRHRAQNAGYTLEQVINEYHVLRRVLFDVLEEGGQELTRRERDLIWDLLFIAIKTAAEEFKQVRDEETQRTAALLDRANAELQTALGATTAASTLKDLLLRTIFERVEDYAMFSLDESGNVTSWTRGCERIKGFTSEEVLGKHYSMLYPDEGRVRKEPQTHLDIARREGRFRGEGLRQRKSGELFMADVFITPMYQGDRQVGFFKIVTDLSERNRIIQERDLSRTRVLSLELESHLRDRFIFTLSHDLRNPLSAASVSAQQIARQRCNVDHHGQLAQRVIQNTRRVDKMIGDLLDASRIKAGEPMPLVLEEFDLAAEVQSVCDDLAIVHGDRFRREGPDTLVGVWDRDGLKRVLENLFTNGIKYGDPAGEVTARLGEAEDRVLILVHNAGSPISQLDLESLFELFHRSDTAVNSPNRGWGLGLTLVRGITEAHGGIVQVRSLPHEGTTFILDLPRNTPPVKRQAPAGGKLDA